MLSNTWLHYAAQALAAVVAVLVVVGLLVGLLTWHFTKEDDGEYTPRGAAAGGQVEGLLPRHHSGLARAA